MRKLTDLCGGNPSNLKLSREGTDHAGLMGKWQLFKPYKKMSALYGLNPSTSKRITTHALEARKV